MATFTENRASRLRDGGTATLFHNTSADREIISEQRMVRGSSGWAGGGIYFAGSENETLQKTQNKGRTLQAKVKLGRVLEVTTSSVKDYSFTELQNLGYDSVKITGIRTGDEYVVYNHDQVSSISYASSSSCSYSNPHHQGNCTHSHCGSVEHVGNALAQIGYQVAVIQLVRCCGTVQRLVPPAGRVYCCQCGGK